MNKTPVLVSKIAKYILKTKSFNAGRISTMAGASPNYTRRVIRNFVAKRWIKKATTVGRLNTFTVVKAAPLQSLVG